MPLTPELEAEGLDLAGILQDSRSKVIITSQLIDAAAFIRESMARN
jgi:hypothetical protein